MSDIWYVNGKTWYSKKFIEDMVMELLEDFSLEIGTPYYDKWVEKGKSLGLDVSSYDCYDESEEE